MLLTTYFHLPVTRASVPIASSGLPTSFILHTQGECATILPRPSFPNCLLAELRAHEVYVSNNNIMNHAVIASVAS